VKVNIMRDAVRAKFTQHEDLRHAAALHRRRQARRAHRKRQLLGRRRGTARGEHARANPHADPHRAPPKPGKSPINRRRIPRSAWYYAAVQRTSAIRGLHSLGGTRDMSSSTATTISVQCPCGKKLKAPASAVGPQGQVSELRQTYWSSPAPAAAAPLRGRRNYDPLYDLAEQAQASAATEPQAAVCPNCHSAHDRRRHPLHGLRGTTRAPDRRFRRRSRARRPRRRRRRRGSRRRDRSHRRAARAAHHRRNASRHRRTLRLHPRNDHQRRLRAHRRVDLVRHRQGDRSRESGGSRGGSGSSPGSA
jgi:hypothetical protein